MHDGDQIKTRVRANLRDLEQLTLLLISAISAIDGDFSLDRDDYET